MQHVDDGRLNALLDGELDPGERQAVEGHLAGCGECRARYEEARRFLDEATSLLGTLDVHQPAAAFVPPAARGSEGRAAAATRAPDPEGTAPPAGPAVPRTVGATGKEAAIDVAASRIAKTGKEQAIEIDGATQKSPAIRPIFAQQSQQVEPESGPSPARRFGTGQLARAAMIVLAVGAGWLANEMLRRPASGGPADRVTGSDAARAGSTQVALGEPSAAPPGEPSSRAAGGRSSAARGSALVKPPAMRGEKPPNGDAAAGRIPRETPPGAARSRASQELAAREADGAGAPVPAGAAGQPTTGAGVAAGPRRSDAAPPPAVAALAPAPAVPAPATEAGAPTRGARAAAQRETPRAFRRVTLDEAVRLLSGSIRLVDGLQPMAVEVGPGNLVPGASPGRDVVRVHYLDESGRPAVLDQQPGDTVGAVSVNGLMRGDTLVTSQPDGSVRVRWVDRKSFWLSLTGTGSPDSVRRLVGRIR